MNAIKIFKKTVSFLLIFVMLFGFASCKSQKNEKLEQQYYDLAKSYLEKGDVSKAVEIVNDGLDRFGESELLSSLIEGESTTSGKITVPNVINLGESAAIKCLESYNLNYEIEYVKDSTASPNTVANCEPNVDDEVEEGAVITLYVVEPDTAETKTKKSFFSKRITSKKATFVFANKLFPAHTSSNAWFTENPYIEDDYLYIPITYNSSCGFIWNDIATVSVEGQMLGAEIIAENYDFQSDTDENFVVKVPVSSLKNEKPSYLEINFMVSYKYDMYFNVTIIW